MITAFVLIVSEPGTEKRVTEELMYQDKIQDADVVYGEYDVVAKIIMEDASQLSDLVEKIRNMAGVKRTSTLITSSAA